MFRRSYDSISNHSPKKSTNCLRLPHESYYYSLSKFTGGELYKWRT